MTEWAASEEPNAALLVLRDARRRPRQLIAGVAADDLEEFGGQFVLGWDDRLPAPGELQASADGAELRRLVAALEALALRSEPRVWPLHQAVQTGDNAPPIVIVSGFVAARVAEVAVRREPFPRLELTLQACELMTNTAVTERRDSAALRNNRYVSKPRLVR